jgi:hypothetical protein
MFIAMMACFKASYAFSRRLWLTSSGRTDNLAEFTSYVLNGSNPALYSPFAAGIRLALG